MHTSSMTMARIGAAFLLLPACLSARREDTEFPVAPARAAEVHLAVGSGLRAAPASGQARTEPPLQEAYARGQGTRPRSAGTVGAASLREVLTEVLAEVLSQLTEIPLK